ncbi:hypothetical protein J2Y67_003302 [Neobacillus niacini]|nr:hypothetical protein [Neobacillus niacini]
MVIIEREYINDIPALEVVREGLLATVNWFVEYL